MAGPASDRSATRRSEVIGALGAITEWYDFSLYVYLAPVYGKVFFPDGSGTEQLLSSLAVFAVAYLARPVGAVVFGHVGDRRGRRSALTTSALLMALALLLNGLLPGESSIGLLAPVLLLLVRLLAGFSVGGEYSGILVFLLETATVRNRGLVASWAPAVAGAGSLLAVGVSAVVTSALTTDQLDSWGWRIPVFVGAGLAFAIYLLRRRLTETPGFRAMEEAGELSSSPVRDVLRTARPAVLVAFGLSAVGSASYYLNITYVPTFLSSFRDVSSAEALRWSTIATAVMLVTTPAFGALSDRVGRRPSLYGLAAVLAVGTPLLFVALDDTGTAGSIVVAATLAVIAGGWSAVCASTIPEQLPTALRFSGIAVGYNAAVAIFGGLTPFVATALVDASGPLAMALVVVSVVSVVALLLVRRIPETARQPLP